MNERLLHVFGSPMSPLAIEILISAAEVTAATINNPDLVAEVRWATERDTRRRRHVLRRLATAGQRLDSHGADFAAVLRAALTGSDRIGAIYIRLREWAAHPLSRKAARANATAWLAARGVAVA